VIRIVALGDSTTAGTPGWKSPLEAPPRGSGDRTSQYAYWLERMHPAWNVTNCGVNGERSDQIRARFERDVVAAGTTSPAKAGGHDVPPSTETPAPSAFSGTVETSVESGFSRTIVVIIAGVNDIYQGLSAGHVIEQLRAMYERAAECGIGVVAGSIVPFNTATPDQNARMRDVNDWIRDHADAGSIEFADTRAAVAASDNADLLFESPDQLHPSPEGYRRMGDVISGAIERLVRRRS
jgi:lysophospholipase L1-like esterase